MCSRTAIATRFLNPIFHSAEEYYMNYSQLVFSTITWVHNRFKKTHRTARRETESWFWSMNACQINTGHTNRWSHARLYTLAIRSFPVIILKCYLRHRVSRACVVRALYTVPLSIPANCCTASWWDNNWSLPSDATHLFSWHDRTCLYWSEAQRSSHAQGSHQRSTDSIRSRRGNDIGPKTHDSELPLPTWTLGRRTHKIPWFPSPIWMKRQVHQSQSPFHGSIPMIQTSGWHRHVEAANAMLAGRYTPWYH